MRVSCFSFFVVVYVGINCMFSDLYLDSVAMMNLFIFGFCW